MGVGAGPQAVLGDGWAHESPRASMLLAAPSVSTVTEAGIRNHGAYRPEYRWISSLGFSLPVCSVKGLRASPAVNTFQGSPCTWPVLTASCPS